MSLSDKINKSAKEMAFLHLTSTPAWGTPGVPGSGNLFYPLSVTGITQAPAKLVTDEECIGIGPGAVVIQKVGEKAIDATMVLQFMPGEPVCTHVLAAIYRYYSATAADTVVTHLLHWNSALSAADTSKLLFTLAWREGTEVKVVNTLMITDLRIYYDQVWLMEVKMFGSHISSVNTTTYDPSTWTAVNADRDGFHGISDASLWLNAQSGADFADGDKIKPAKFEISYALGYQKFGQNIGDLYDAMPMEGDKNTVSCKMEFNYKDATNAAYWQGHHNITKYKMKFQLDGGDILATATHAYAKFWFPGLYIPEDMTADYKIESPTGVSLGMKLQLPTSNPTGMDHTTPYAELKNGVAVQSGYPAVA